MARARKTAPKPDEDSPTQDVVAEAGAPAETVSTEDGEPAAVETSAPEVALPEPDVAEVAASVRHEEPPPPPREVVRIEKRGGAGPLILGGLIAGGLGFASAAYVIPHYFPQAASGDASAEIGAELTSQTEKIAAVQSELEALKSTAPAPAAVPEEVTAGIAQLGDRVQALEQASAGIEERFGALETRIGAIESRPVTGDAASAGALDAIRREMEGYRAEIADQLKAVEAAKGDIGAAAEAAAAKVASVEAEAERLRGESEAAAKAAVLTGSVARIMAALDSGAAIDGPVADLSAAGVKVPAALAEQAQGVPTLESLRESFPEAARDTLAVSVREASDPSTWGRITAFFRSQSGARSLSPRAGTDPDAILSRAEANLQAGDLANTLKELGTLPEAGKAVMAEWMTRAEHRQQAVEAADALEQQVK